MEERVYSSYHKDDAHTQCGRDVEIELEGNGRSLTSMPGAMCFHSFNVIPKDATTNKVQT